MEVTSGREEVIIGLIDGSVDTSHPALMSDHIRAIPGTANSQCIPGKGAACSHGTFIAGILMGKRGSIAPAICPNCTLLVRPIFTETGADKAEMPGATPEELSQAIYDCVTGGVRILNLSAAIIHTSLKSQQELAEALSYAVRKGVIVVVAAGNQGTVGSSVITRHPGVIPVVACNLQGYPLNLSNLSSTIGQRGLQAPGEQVASLGINGNSLTLSGTSVATPFVTGTVALLWSEFLTATATQIKQAITQVNGMPRRRIVPPRLDAWRAYQVMATAYGRSINSRGNSLVFSC